VEELKLQKILPAYVRQQVARRVKDLQPGYDKSLSLRPLIVSLKNMCIKEAKMTAAQVDMLTSERLITHAVTHYMNATQSLIDIGVLMSMYVKAVGGAESVNIVYNTAKAVNPMTGQHGPVMTCMLCDQEPRTCGSYCPHFGQPSSEEAYIYYVCGVQHMPPTSEFGDENLRKMVLKRLEEAKTELEKKRAAVAVKK
jgi:hypothetical protein